MTRESAALEGIREFHIGDILSITDGHLVSPRHMVGVHDILSYMAGVPKDQLFDIQLGGVADIAAPSLREQHPDLASIVVPDMRGEDIVHSWLGGVVTEYGETRLVLPLHDGAYQHRSGIEDAADIFGAQNTFVVNPDTLS